MQRKDQKIHQPDLTGFEGQGTMLMQSILNGMKEMCAYFDPEMRVQW